MRFLIETKGYYPKKQLDGLSKIGDIEDYWGEDEDKPEPINQNQACYEAIKGIIEGGVNIKEEITDDNNNVIITVEHKIERGYYVVNNVKDEFTLNVGWLEKDKVKEIFPEFKNYKSLYEKIKVKSGDKERIGWITTRAYSGASSYEDPVIYRGGSICPIGTDKKLITIIEQK